MLFSCIYQKGEHITDVYFRRFPENSQAPATDVLLRKLETYGIYIWYMSI